MLTSLGAPDDDLARPAPARRGWTFSRGQRQLAQLGLADSGGDLQPVADLAVHLDDAGDRRPRPAAPGRPSASRPWRPTARGPAAPSTSSAVYGATSDSMTASVSAASRTAGSAAPGPESMALRAALTSSIRRATATLKRWASISRVTSSMVRWVTLRSSTSPRRVRGRAPAAATSPASRSTPAQELQRRRRPTCRPSRCRPRAGRRTSSSAGPRPRRARPAARPGPRRCPATCDMALPWLITWPWFIMRGERLDEVDHAHVVQHLGEEPAVQQVQDGVLDAADVQVDRAPSGGPPRPRTGRSRSRASSNAGSTRTSRRTCPSCRCRAGRGRRTWGTRR